MPFPNVDKDFETFFEPTRIWLFGKPFNSLKYERGSMDKEFSEYNAPAKGAKLPMPPRRIERTLRRQSMAAGTPLDPMFARIYSFSFEGHYYKLPRPLLFLVPGTGKPVYGKGKGEAEEPPGAAPQKPDDTGRVVFYTKFAGVEARDWHFSDDIRVWAVDRKDLAVCLDIEIGNYEQILLESMIAFQEEMASRGAGAARGAAVSRGAAASRGAASFRGAVLGPHQDR